MHDLSEPVATHIGHMHNCTAVAEIHCHRSLTGSSSIGFINKRSERGSICKKTTYYTTFRTCIVVSTSHIWCYCYTKGLQVLQQGCSQGSLCRAVTRTGDSTRTVISNHLSDVQRCLLCCQGCCYMHGPSCGCGSSSRRQHQQQSTVSGGLPGYHHSSRVTPDRTG